MIGIDIISNKRMIKYLNNEKMLCKILSEDELLVFKKITNPKRQTEYLARCFAGKEAYFKALGTNEAIAFSKISILNDENGKPFIKLQEQVLTDMLITISHETAYTVVVVVNKHLAM